MQENAQLSIYEMSVNVLVAWQAHSLSTIGASTDRSENSSHLSLPAASAMGGEPPHSSIDPITQDLLFERIVRECALCDTHGFLVTARNAAGQAGTAARQEDQQRHFDRLLLRPGSSRSPCRDRTASYASRDLQGRWANDHEDTRPLRRVRPVCQVSLCGHRRIYAALASVCEGSNAPGKEAPRDPAGAAGFAGEPGWRACSYDASPLDRAQWSDHGAHGCWSFSSLFSA